MNIGIISTFKDFLDRSFKVDVATGAFEEAKVFYKELAIQSCISVIANALVLSEFETFENGKKVQKENYYLLNIEPNQNQNATEFWVQAISKLVYENECLIIQDKNQLFVADTFNIDKSTYYEDHYKDIVIRDYPLKKTFKESEVLYLKLNNKNIKNIIDGLYIDYSKLLGSAMTKYKKSNGRKGTLELETYNSQSKEHQEALSDLMNNKFKQYFEAENAVLPLQKGYKYDEKPNTSNIKDSRDVRCLIDDIFDFVAAAFHIPTGILKGDVAIIEGQTDNFLMFGINPIANLIKSEINRKMYGKSLFLKRCYVKINTRKIRNTSLENIAKACDLLFRIGVNSINDNLDELGREKLTAKWADEHYVTKNYQSVLEMDSGGGKKDGKESSKPGDS